MIIDAGAGNKMDAKLQEIYGFDRAEHLDVSLAAAGAARRTSSIALASHLHFDHAGGLTARMANGPSCPGSRTRATSSIGASGRMRRTRTSATAPATSPRTTYRCRTRAWSQFMDGDGEVMPGVRVRRTGGHTRWHQIVYIESQRSRPRSSRRI